MPILILESLQKGGLKHNMFTYFIIHIYIIISCSVSSIFVTIVSYIIAPIYVMYIGF